MILSMCCYLFRYQQAAVFMEEAASQNEEECTSESVKQIGMPLFLLHSNDLFFDILDVFC